MKRSSGILLPISALPSPYGIGSFGQAAYDFADFLHESGQHCWQILPLGPTSYGDSPYQSFSSYAGNPYFIDLDLLIADGLLQPADVDTLDWGRDPRNVDYEKMHENRFSVLAKAKAKGWKRDKAKVDAFAKANARWLDDYTLFMALKRHFGMTSWLDWPNKELRLHHPKALTVWREKLREDIELFTYIQYLFFQQWDKLKRYINDLGIQIIGDLPIYVAMDSADVWAEPGMFQLDAEGFPTAVSGVPPDYFTADGQLWGNPLYDYDAMARDGYGWWIRRVDGVARLYDIIRIDHFRGFASYWAVPYGDKTARNGHWVHGPGMRLVGVLKGWFHNLEFVAEDLGVPTPDVEQLLAESGLPGMKVLEFAFDAKEPSNYLPHAYTENCVCYTGTHDNAPLNEWLAEADPEDLAFAKRYLGLNEEEGFDWGILRAGMGSVAELFVAQMQDYLGLGKGARINTPGTLGGNWTWRLLPGELDQALADKLYEMTRIYDRLQNPRKIVADETEDEREINTELPDSAAIAETKTERPE